MAATDEDKTAAAKLLEDYLDKAIAADPDARGERLKAALDTLWLQG